MTTSLEGDTRPLGTGPFETDTLLTARAEPEPIEELSTQQGPNSQAIYALFFIVVVTFVAFLIGFYVEGKKHGDMSDLKRFVFGSAMTALAWLGLASAVTLYTVPRAGWAELFSGRRPMSRYSREVAAALLVFVVVVPCAITLWKYRRRDMIV